MKNNVLGQWHGDGGWGHGGLGHGGHVAIIAPVAHGWGHHGFIGHHHGW